MASQIGMTVEQRFYPPATGALHRQENEGGDGGAGTVPPFVARWLGVRAGRHVLTWLVQRRTRGRSSRQTTAFANGRVG